MVTRKFLAARGRPNPDLWSGPVLSEATIPLFPQAKRKKSILWSASLYPLASAANDVDNGISTRDGIMRRKAGPDMFGRYILETPLVRIPAGHAWLPEGTEIVKFALNRSPKSGDENSVREIVACTYCLPGGTWDQAANMHILAQNAGGGYNYSCGHWLYHDNNLYSIDPSFQGTSSVGGHFLNMVTAVFRLDPGPGIGVWTKIDLDEPICRAWMLSEALWQPEGYYLADASDVDAEPCYMVSQGRDIFKPWSLIRTPRPDCQRPSFGESGHFRRMDGRRQKVIRPPGAGRAYTNVANADGSNPSIATRCSLVMQNKKPAVIRLSNGVLLIVVAFSGVDTGALYFGRPFTDVCQFVYDIEPGNPPPVFFKYDPDTGEQAGYSYDWTGEEDDVIITDKRDTRAGWTYYYATEAVIDGVPSVIITCTQNHEDVLRYEFAISELVVPEVSQGPIAHWPLNETAGTIAYDVSGHGNHGTIYGSPGNYVAARAGKRGFKFDGVGQYISIPKPAGLNTFLPFMVTMFGKFSAFGTTDRMLIGSYSADSGYAWRFYTYHAGGDKLAFQINARAGNTTIYTEVYDAQALGSYDGLAAGFDPVSGEVFVYRKSAGGVLTRLTNPLISGTKPTIGWYSPSENLMIGAAGTPGAPTLVMNGSISDVEIYNRILPMAELAAKFADDPVQTYGAYDADVAAYFGKFVNPPSLGFATAVQTFVTSSKASGTWPKRKRVHILAADDDQQGLIDLKNPSGDPLARQGSPAFQTRRGYTGNSTTKVRLTTTTAVTAYGMTLDNAHQTVAVLTDISSTASDCGNNGFSIGSRNGIYFRGRGNENTFQNYGLVEPTGVGISHINITGATTYDDWKNGVKLGQKIRTTPTQQGTGAYTVCGANSTDVSDRQVAYWEVGLTYTDVEAAAAYAEEYALLHALGAL